LATGSWPTLLDVALRSDPDGNIPVMAEMLSQCNEIMDDAPYIEANEMAGHMFTFRTSIPAGTWRTYNQGTPYGKSTVGKARVGLGMLEDWSQVDRSLARHSGNVEKFRASEDVAFLEGMSQTIVQTIFYGNTRVNPSTFMGFSPFYNTVNTATADNAANVLNGGGTGSSNASLWLIGWGEDSISLLYPRGSQAGLEVEDRGDGVPGYDSFGNPFPAYTTLFHQEIGLMPKDWRYASRLANLDVTAAGLAGPNAYDIFAGIDDMYLLFPEFSAMTSGITKTDASYSTKVRGVLYANRTLRHWMNIQAMRNRNVLLRLEDYAGKVTDNYRGVPIKTVDQLLNTESQVV
jgi:hypothetical protein